MTREKAAKIAKDLVEGGIDDPMTVRVTAEGHNVTQSAVRRIRNCVLGIYAPKRNADYGYSWEQIRIDHACSMVDAIANGWEDETLNLR